MTAFFVLLLLWVVAYAAILIWSLMKRSRIAGVGLALIALSFLPMIYGRWITPSDWHDSPLMAVYYLPTMLAAFLSLIVVVVGLVIKIRRAVLTRGRA